MTTQNEKEREQGLSLLDIGPLSANVPVGTEGKSLKVSGVSAKGIFIVFQRYPEIAQWFKGGIAKIDPKMLLAEAPEAIAAVIAAGCGSPGDEAAEAVAGSLPIEAQLDVLEAIAKMTFTRGFGPFVQRIVALSALAESQNYGRASGMKLPPQSKPASQPDTTAKPSGE